MALRVDANGIVLEPARFAGRHIDEVEKYLEGLEEAITNPTAPPPAVQPVKEETEAEKAAKRLAASANNRLDPVQEQTLKRLEQDDEEAFIATVSDYAKYKEKIDKLKATIHPVARAQKGLHRTLYINVKSEDPEIRKRVYAPVDEAPVETAEEKAAREEEEEEARLAAPPVTPPSRVRAAPPMAAPTPRAREAAKVVVKKAKLVANDKLIAFCRANRFVVEDYLLRLEEQGKTQEDIDKMGQMGRSTESRGSKAYERKFAAR